MNIVFEEDDTYGYRSRTIKNASADVTIAFACDFNSAGEKLTKQSVLDQNKLYIKIELDKLISKEVFINTANDLAKSILCLNKPKIILNVAGNGLYTLRNSPINNQNTIDYYVYVLLNELVNILDNRVIITMIRSGGQSGVDEAGIKAAIKLNIPTYILAPKGWVFRDEFGVDYSDEAKFKNRFNIQ